MKNSILSRYFKDYALVKLFSQYYMAKLSLPESTEDDSFKLLDTRNNLFNMLNKGLYGKVILSVKTLSKDKVVEDQMILNNDPILEVHYDVDFHIRFSFIEKDPGLEFFYQDRTVQMNLNK